MKPADHIAEASDILARIDVTTLLKRIDAAAPGIKAASYDGPMVSSGQGPSDPTGRAATPRTPEGGRDRWSMPIEERQTKQVIKWSLELHTICLALHKIQSNYTTPAPWSRDRLEAAGERLCDYCLRYPTRSPQIPKGEAPTDVGGRASLKRWTCSQHYDLIRRVWDTTMAEPTDAHFEHYASTGRYPTLKGATA